MAQTRCNSRSRAVSVSSMAMIAGLLFAGSAQAQDAGDPPNAAKPNKDIAYQAASHALDVRMARVTPVTEAMLDEPAAGDWLGWRRGNRETGFSPLKSIDVANAANLRVAWSWALPPSANEITPLAHDGIVFVNSGDSVEAFDGATGDRIWAYKRVLPAALENGAHAAVRNIAIYDDKVFVPTADGHMVALAMRTGKPVWDHEMLGPAERAAHISITGGPVVAHGKVMQGTSFCMTYKGGCFIVALDARTGAEAWRFHTVARPGQPGGDSWNGAPVDQRFGGAVWTAGSYDPALNLVYFGVGQTYDAATLLSPRSAGGGSRDALYTDSTVALDPDTGKLVWHFQHFKTDTWDQDWAFEQSLIDIEVDGRPRPVLVTAGKLGIFDVLDRRTGAYIRSFEMGGQNLVIAIDPKTGDKTVNPALVPKANIPETVCPHAGGIRSWPAGAIDASARRVYMVGNDSCMDYTWKPQSAEKTAAGAMDIDLLLKPAPGGDGKFGRVQAIDLKTGKTIWTQRRRAAQTSATVATAGGVLFEGGIDRFFRALDSSTGATLWQTRLNAAPSSTPITYAVSGRQFVAVVAGGGSAHEKTFAPLAPEFQNPEGGTTLWVFALPPAAR